MIKVFIKRRMEKLQERARGDYEFRPKWARWGALVHNQGVKLIHRGRWFVRFMNPHLTNEVSDWFVHGQLDLNHRISEILARQKEEYGPYSYFYGYLYQALGILNIYGERSTEERYDAYHLRDVLNKNDRVLDIGCNSGFMSVLASYRSGARVDGLDINPYMIEIGQEVAKYLNLSGHVKLWTQRIQEFEPKEPYDVVFSFATHWTDDEQYRVTYEEHFDRMASYLKPGGVLVFETHSADLQDKNYDPAMKEAEKIFEVLLRKATDAGERHLWHLKKR